MTTLSAAEARALETLFDHQMWAFGRDVARPEGNLFAQKGFTRVPAPAGAAHSSTWIDARAAERVSLSSLGVTYERGQAALRLERGPLQPQLVGAALELLPGLAAWVIDYERWVALAAPGWRAQALASRQRPSRFDAEGLANGWVRFARSGSASPAVTRAEATSPTQSA